jgi:hypothetical protein
VLFSTGDPLVAGDTDGFERDLYDARIDGGLESPPVAGACDAGSCEGASSAPPAPPVAGGVSVGQVSPAVASALRAVDRRKSSSGKTGSRGKLSKALKACRSRHRAGKTTCERAARRRFGSSARALSSKGERR